MKVYGGSARMVKQPRKWKVVATSVAILASLLVGVPQTANAAEQVPAAGKSVNAAEMKALVGSQFDPGFIISDRVFFDKNAMTEAGIQSWLEAKLPTCAQSNDAACIKNYTETTNSRDASPAGNCAAYAGAANERASTIIWKVAQACGINPQVILVTLQKEQGLITKGSPTALEYRKAMGYGCPDTSVCDSKYYGFFNQVYSAAWQFRQYTLFPNRTYKIGNVAVRYAPAAGCEGPVVNIKNQATANLYNYTPYQPNAATLAKLEGSNSAACSSYGNRNFWVYFNNWFGSSTGAINPVGVIDAASVGPGVINVSGWVFDPDSKDPTQVHVYVNGVGTAFDANIERPDLIPAYGDIGSRHGYSVSVPVTTSGPQSVCVYGINTGPGANTTLGCRTLQPMTGSPVGAVDTVTAGLGTITVAGWAFDPDLSTPIPIHVYTDNVLTEGIADQARSDIGAIYPAYGANHGFSFTYAAAPGKHSVCIYGIEMGGTGSNSLRGCRTVTVPTGSPIGAIDSVTAGPGTISVSGWMIDPDTATSTPVHIYSDATLNEFVADSPRSDIDVLYPGYGANHGFSVSFAATPGKHTVCVYGIEIAGTGANASKGCRVVTVPTGSPVGVVDSITTGPGTITVQGWMFDPDLTASIPVHIYTGSVLNEFVADSPRADIASIYPGYGPNHGLNVTYSAAPGEHTVCVYGIEMGGTGSNSLRGCRVVVVPAP